MAKKNQVNKIIAPRKRKPAKSGLLSRKDWLWAWGLVLFVALIGCGLVISIFNGVSSEPADFKEDISDYIDSYMKNMMARDYKRAYSQFLPDLRPQLKWEYFRDMAYSTDYAYFYSYEDLEITSYQLTDRAIFGGQQQNYSEAYVEGIFNYSNGYTGTFRAQLAHRESFWWLINIEINISPTQVEAFLEAE